MLAALNLPLVQERIRDRLGELSGRLGNADWHLAMLSQAFIIGATHTVAL
jgi:hypothetical protein